jgi:FtsZ-binding cell division protein ZapB
VVQSIRGEVACTDDSLIAVEAKGDVEDKSEISLLVQIAKDIAVLKDQNKELTTELAATKQSVAYLAAQNDDLREQLHNSQPAYSKLITFLKTPPSHVPSSTVMQDLPAK